MDRPRKTKDEFRNSQIKWLETEFSNLVEDDMGAAAKFLELACDTFDCLPEDHLHQLFPFKPQANSAWNLAVGEENAKWNGLPAPLQARWIAWRGIWDALKDRNPRLDLADMMSSIGESHNASSWPYSREDLIEDWVATGGIEHPPFDDCYEIVAPEFYSHLRHLRSQVGGWVCWSDSLERVEFLPEAMWQERKAQMRGVREDGQRRSREIAAWMAKHWGPDRDKD